MRYFGIAFTAVFGLLVSGCDSQVEQSNPRSEIPLHDGDVEADTFSMIIDSDEDGLCDSSELVAGTSADNPDSDGDSFPDVIEVSYGLDALDPNVPRDEQIVFLVEANGASTTLVARVQVEGVGEQYTGLFESFDPIYSQTTTAADLLVGVRATAANPPDNVHGIEETAARFASVQGLTELTFTLEFAYGEQSLSDEQSLSLSECKRGYPFSFSAKRPDKSQVDIEHYLLVSIPAGTDSAQVSWCIPEYCL